MWFGDLVTMKWWNDLWLKESFADFAAITCLKNCKYSFPTADFSVLGHLMKSWGYAEDQNKTTHPIAGEVRDTAEAESIFDGITYSKGSSVLVQLFHLVGSERFKAGLRKYFKRFEWGNTDLKDLIDTLKEEYPENTGFSLDEWCKEWICTAGLNECEFVWGEGCGRIVQRCALNEFPRLRRHKMKVAFFRKDGTFDTVDFLVKNESESVIMRSCEDYCAVLPNYADESFVKVCLDKKSLEFFKGNLGVVREPGTRILIWRAFYDMVRDAKIGSFEFIELVKRFIFAEKEMTVMNYVLNFAWNSVSSFTPFEFKKKYNHLLFSEIYTHLVNSPSLNNEDEIILKSKLLTFADDEEDIHTLVLWYKGEEKKLEKFALSLENEWRIIVKIHLSKKYPIEFKREILALQNKKDDSEEAKRTVKECCAIVADPEEKDKLWQKFIVQDMKESEKSVGAAMRGFNHEEAFPENDRFIEEFFKVILDVFMKSSSVYANSFFDFLYPQSSDIELLVKKNRDLLDIVPGDLSQLIRQVKDKSDSLEMKLKCFKRFREDLEKI